MSEILTARVMPDLKDRLDQLAKSTHRAKSWLINEALRSYLDANSWQIEAIEKGVKDAKQRKLIPGKKVDEWLKSWGSPSEKAFKI